MDQITPTDMLDDINRNLDDMLSRLDQMRAEAIARNIVLRMREKLKDKVRTKVVQWIRERREQAEI